MPPPARVLLSIDYEPWFALVRRYDGLADPAQRQGLDAGFTRAALDPILESLGSTKASFYLVGEVADWYPAIPSQIIAAGHELGLHCHIHRPLVSITELQADLKAAAVWCAAYGIRGYRAPMIGISEAAYPLLEAAGLKYSSSIYAPAGTLLRRGNMWEIPVSTVKVFGAPRLFSAPRGFSLGLLAAGEIPYGSSFSIGLMGHSILKLLERELHAGRSPVIILHPYELVRPARWLSRLAGDLILHPFLWAFTRNKARFLDDLLRSFPVSPLGTYLDEALAAMGDAMQP